MKVERSLKDPATWPAFFPLCFARSETLTDSHNFIETAKQLLIIMKSAIIAAVIGSAAAFAPAPVAKTTTAVNAFEDELGAQPPLGFFDPFGMLSGDVTQERFDRLRYVEIKHGRIAQLAFLGQIVTRAGIHLPGNIDYGKFCQNLYFA